MIAGAVAVLFQLLPPLWDDLIVVRLTVTMRETDEPRFARFIVIFGMIVAVVGCGLLPVGVVISRDRGWIYLLDVVWLVLPSIALLLSLREWFAHRKIGATADAIVACGVAAIWLFLVVAEMARNEGYDWGLIPYLVALGVLGFIIMSFLAFVRTVSPEGTLVRSGILTWVYGVLFTSSVLIIAIVYVLVFYFQILLE